MLVICLFCAYCMLVKFFVGAKLKFKILSSRPKIKVYFHNILFVKVDTILCTKNNLGMLS